MHGSPFYYAEVLPYLRLCGMKWSATEHSLKPKGDCAVTSDICWRQGAFDKYFVTLEPLIYCRVEYWVIKRMRRTTGSGREVDIELV